jgi:flagellar hook-basal body complex protein FliE
MDVRRIEHALPPPVRIGSAGEPPAGPGAAPAASEASFGRVLADSLRQVNALQQEADTAIQSLATGGPVTLHDTILAVQKAELSFKLMLQVRNKIVEAYQEVLRMQV